MTIALRLYSSQSQSRNGATRVPHVAAAKAFASLLPVDSNALFLLLPTSEIADQGGLLSNAKQKNRNARISALRPVKKHSSFRLLLIPAGRHQERRHITPSQVKFASIRTTCCFCISFSWPLFNLFIHSYPAWCKLPFFFFFFFFLHKIPPFISQWFLWEWLVSAVWQAGGLA